MENAMKWLSLITMVVELVNKGMETVEKCLDPGTGKIKKELVMSIVKDAVGEETWAKIEAWISVLINLKALVKFGSSGKDPQ